MRYGRIIGAIVLATLLMAACDDDPAKSDAGADTGADVAADVVADTVADAAPDTAVDANSDTDGAIGPTGCFPPTCDDGSPCTVDECDTALQTCNHTPILDGTPCGCGNVGQCFAGTCIDGQGVCNSNAQCNDGFVCTFDRCDGCQCVTEPIPDCIE
jgi:hypothetical protein